MTNIRLKTTAKRQLRKASRDATTAYFQNLTEAVKRTKWIAKGNRYRADCTRRYQKDLGATPVAVDHVALTAYIAASSPAHVIDGWALLGWAVDAALRSDSYVAVHVAYYAELRVAMALLASEGVGILNYRHPTVDASSHTSFLPKVEKWDPTGAHYQSSWAGTHAIVWPCLQHWAGLQKAFDLLDELVQPANIRLSEWLVRLGAVGAARAIADKWLRSWGLDLSIVEEDHESRNLVSYRPSEFRPAPSLPVGEILEFVNDLCANRQRIVEPEGAFNRQRMYTKHVGSSRQQP
jgi:hypothetical protein